MKFKQFHIFIFRLLNDDYNDLILSKIIKKVPIIIDQYGKKILQYVNILCQFLRTPFLKVRKISNKNYKK